MLTKIQKWGNSIGLRVPKAFADSLELEDSTLIELSLEGDQLIVRKVPSPLPSADFRWIVPSDRVEDWRAATWQLSATLELSDIHPHAVHFAIFDEDPIPTYIEAARRMLPSMKARLEELAVEQDDHEGQEIVARNAWNSLFRSIPGHRVLGLDSIVGPDSVLTYPPADSLWLITKPIQVDGTPFAWSVHLLPEAGTRSELALSLANSVNLVELLETEVNNST